MDELMMKDILNRNGYYLTRPYRAIYVYQGYKPIGTFNSIIEAFNFYIRRV